MAKQDKNLSMVVPRNRESFVIEEMIVEDPEAIPAGIKRRSTHVAVAKLTWMDALKVALMGPKSLRQKLAANVEWAEVEDSSTDAFDEGVSPYTLTVSIYKHESTEHILARCVLDTASIIGNIISADLARRLGFGNDDFKPLNRSEQTSVDLTGSSVQFLGAILISWFHNTSPRVFRNMRCLVSERLAVDLVVGTRTIIQNNLLTPQNEAFSSSRLKQGHGLTRSEAHEAPSAPPPLDIIQPSPPSQIGHFTQSTEENQTRIDLGSTQSSQRPKSPGSSKTSTPPISSHAPTSSQSPPDLTKTKPTEHLNQEKPSHLEPATDELSEPIPRPGFQDLHIAPSLHVDVTNHVPDRQTRKHGALYDRFNILLTRKLPIVMVRPTMGITIGTAYRDLPLESDPLQENLACEVAIHETKVKNALNAVSRAEKGNTNRKVLVEKIADLETKGKAVPPTADTTEERVSTVGLQNVAQEATKGVSEKLQEALRAAKWKLELYDIHVTLQKKNLEWTEKALRDQKKSLEEQLAIRTLPTNRTLGVRLVVPYRARATRWSFSLLKTVK
ncbi:hypothetical protein BU23DRAFT_599930 [Bimuria novae-zelandiae CBS 107.79]|uniref:Uncharacterized protein n=1 Tax=Bimuria novae-zelandiae CBS 107.79 TaxID=1447943 RepID=A0A6A5V439_9PLEO|nr:hypothetical protein BU23DRAFT_599930 [Bimuria novae-zelandiae CBS 107.79]